MGSKKKKKQKTSAKYTTPSKHTAPGKTAAVVEQSPAVKRQMDTKRMMLISALIGGILFVLIYGVRILNPLYDDWLLAGGDLTQHYVGWVFFRRSGWSFPLGLTEGLLGDIKTSCFYTDSIPLLSIFFKLLSPILPQTFQYFGILGLFSFMLNGAFSSLLIHRFNPNRLFCIGGSVIYVLCPAILHRLYGHESLACHYIIVLGLLLWAYQNHNWQKKWQKYFMAPILWGILGIVTIGTHVYFLPMVFCAMLGCFITDTFLYHKLERALFSAAALTFTSVITMWLCGAFYGEGSAAAYGLGVYSANLNTFWNPMPLGDSYLAGYPAHGSSFFAERPYTSGQYEGYAYLGLGVIMAVFISLFVTILRFARKDGGFFSNLRSAVIAKKVWIKAVAIVFIVAMFFAVSPVAVFNTTELYNITYHPSVMNLLGTFRASGRFAWVGDYLIFTAVMYGLSQIKNKKAMLAVLAACICVQIADQGNSIYSRRWYKEKQTYVSCLQDPRWETLAEGCDKFVGLPYDQPTGTAYTFAIFALQHDMTVSHFHVARPPIDSIIDQYYRNIEKISSGNADPTALYVFLSEEYIPDAEGLKVYELDGFYVVKCPNQYDPLEDTQIPTE